MVAQLLLAVYFAILSFLNVFNLPAGYLQMTYKKIEDNGLRKKYRFWCGLVDGVVAVCFAAMAYVEKAALLEAPVFVTVYILLGVLICIWQVLLNRKYLGTWR